MLTALADPDETIRVETALGLHARQDEVGASSLEVLEAGLRSGNLSVQFNLASALAVDESLRRKLHVRRRAAVKCARAWHRALLSLNALTIQRGRPK